MQTCNYFKMIRTLLSKKSARDVLDIIITDVVKNNDEINVNKVDYLILCKIINELVKKYMDNNKNVMDKKLHYFRNYLNRNVPNTLDDIYKQKNWHLIEPEKSIYHMFGNNGEYNTKFVSGNGYFEGVYNKKGMLITTPINMGTYNYGNPFSPFATDHLYFDVFPYFKYGNVPPGIPSTDEILNASKNLKRYYNNEEAIEYHKYIYDTFKGVY